jgi:hypothetical protein
MAGYITVTVTQAPNPGESPADAEVKVQSMDSYKGDVDMTFSAGTIACSPSTKEISLSSNGSRLVTVSLTGAGEASFTATGTGENEEYDEDTTGVELTI